MILPEVEQDVEAKCIKNQFQMKVLVKVETLTHHRNTIIQVNYMVMQTYHMIQTNLKSSYKLVWILITFSTIFSTIPLICSSSDTFKNVPYMIMLITTLWVLWSVFLTTYK